MLFELAIIIDVGTESKSYIIHDLAMDIQAYMCNKNYGNDVEKYLIGITIVNPPKGFEHFVKKQKPKYTAYKMLKNKFTGEDLEIVKQYDDNIVITGEDYLRFLPLDEDNSRKFIASEILKSLNHLDYLSKKVKDFDTEKFKRDIIDFFKSRELIN